MIFILILILIRQKLHREVFESAKINNTQNSVEIRPKSI